MPQQQAPFLEGKYGWNFGESGWNTGMDENLLKFSFMFDGNVDSIVASLPPVSNGAAHFNSTDNRFYFGVGTVWYSSPCPKSFIFKIKSNGHFYQFNGTSAVKIDSPSETDSRLGAVELTVSSLGTAAFQNVEDFATQAELDVVEGQAQNYTDVLRQDLVDDTDPAKGAGVVGYRGRTVAEKLNDFVSVKDFGAVGNGIADDTDAINAAILAAHNAGGGVVYLPAGTYLLGVITPSIYNDWGGIIAGYNSWALLFARSNVTVCGDGDLTVLKAADNLVASNATMPGTKGFQVFVHEDYQTAVDDFVVRDLRVDFNGLNNLVGALNSHGNQAVAHGIYIETGARNGVERVTWENHPGQQIVSFGYSTTDCFVRRCVFRNNGWLGGVNALLVDHSSIYCAGRDYIIDDNLFTQPDIVPVGAAYEMHGIGTASNNRTFNYAAISNVASTFGEEKDADLRLINNTSRNTGGGVGVYCLGAGRTLKVRLQGNDFILNGKPPTDFPLVGRFKQMINAGNVDADGRKVVIESIGNRYAVMPSEWEPGEDDLLNSAFETEAATGIFKSDTFSGFRGPIVELLRCNPTQFVSFDSCTFSGCGRSREFVTNNALVNYTNRGLDNHGVRLYRLEFNNNTFDEGCAYAAYLSIQQVVLGLAIAPVGFSIQGDTVDGWLPPTVGLGNIGESLFRFNYKCLGPVDLARPLPYATEVARVSRGKIWLDNGGWQAEFRTNYNVAAWNFHGDWNDGTPPASPRPFGDLVGDRLNVLFTLGGNSPVQFVCIASGTAGGVGTWVGLLLN